MSTMAAAGVGEIVERSPVRPMQILDRQAPALLAHPRDELGDCLSLPAIASSAVHSVVEAAQLARLLNVQEIIEVHAAIGREEAALDASLRGGLAFILRACCGEIEDAAHQRADGVLLRAHSEAEHQPAVGREPHARGGRLDLLEESRLADTRLAANVDGLAATGPQAIGQNRLELIELLSSADERLAG